MPRMSARHVNPDRAGRYASVLASPQSQTITWVQASRRPGFAVCHVQTDLHLVLGRGFEHDGTEKASAIQVLALLVAPLSFTPLLRAIHLARFRATPYP